MDILRKGQQQINEYGIYVTDGDSCIIEIPAIIQRAGYFEYFKFRTTASRTSIMPLSAHVH